MKRLGLVVVALLVTACGGGASTPESTEAPSVQATESSAGETESAGAASTAFCQELDEQLALLGQLPAKLQAGDDLTQLLDDIRTNGGQLVDSAPPEIRDDADAIVTAMAALADSLGPGGRPSAEVAEIIASPEIQRAGNNLRSYAENTCDLG